MAKNDEAQQQQSAEELHEASGRRVEDDADGTPRVVQAPGVDEPVEAADVTPGGGLVMAPQHWDAESQTFEAGPGDPHAENVDALNEAQQQRGDEQASSGRSGRSGRR